jgi:hypothetical protein
MQYYM